MSRILPLRTNPIHRLPHAPAPLLSHQPTRMERPGDLPLQLQRLSQDVHAAREPG